MNRKNPERISHEEVKAMRRVAAWLTKIGRLDELQQVVTNDVANIADEALTSRAVVAVRLANRGNPGVMRPPVRRRSDDAWTEAMDEQMRVRYYERGQTFAQIAEAMGRTDEACRSRARRLGWEPSYELTRWTAAEDEALAALMKAKVGSKRIAAEVGRSLQAVLHRMRHLQLTGAIATEKSHHAYTVAEMDALRTQWEAGARIREIAAALGRSEGSVIHQARRIGLTGTRTSPLPVYNTRPYRNLTAIGRVAERRKLARLAERREA
jgi:hypothetical protein